MPKIARKQSEAQREGWLRLSGETGSTDSMILHFQPPERWDPKLLIVPATPLVVYHYNGPGKQTQPHEASTTFQGPGCHLTAFDDSKPLGGRKRAWHITSVLRDLGHRAGLHCTSEYTHVDLRMSPDSRRASHEEGAGHVSTIPSPLSLQEGQL